KKIALQSNPYDEQTSCHNFNITTNEIRVVCGSMLNSGYHRLPSKKIYWKTKPDCHRLLVANAMRIDLTGY
ncbi:hypothetical protein ILUMI_16264, partial [Ignelater luminosus]